MMLAAFFAACDGGPSDGEFETACLNEGSRGANKALRREMGIKSEVFCKCVAKEARSHLSAQGRQAMMLDMQGKPQEARAITAKMKEPEQMEFMKGGMRVAQTCMTTSMK
jgi:hypothetical protein